LVEGERLPIPAPRPTDSRTLRMCGRWVRQGIGGFRIGIGWTSSRCADKRCVIVIATRPEDYETHTAQSARCVGHPRVTGAPGRTAPLKPKPGLNGPPVRASGAP